MCSNGTYCGSPFEYNTLDPLLDDPWNDEMILYNTVNYNNILNAAITIFEALTLEGWSS